MERFYLPRPPGAQKNAGSGEMLDEILPSTSSIIMAAHLEMEVTGEAGTSQSNGAFTQALTEVAKNSTKETSPTTIPA